MKRRLFLAVPISEKIKKGLVPLQESLEIDSLRWVNPENLHITVFFMGFVDEWSVDVIKAASKKALQNIAAFTLEFEKITFAPERKPGMIWAKYLESDAFTNIVITAEKALSPYTEKTRNYTTPIPHITLARFRGKAEFELPEFRLDDIPVSELVLYESHLSPTGPTYVPLETYRLTEPYQDESSVLQGNS